MSRPPTEVRTDLTPRLNAAAQAVRDAEQALRDARERRDELIIDAANDGMVQRQVASAAGVSQTRVIAVLLERGQ